MKAYKAMRDNMTCRGFQYKLGEKHKMSSDIELGKRGFHAAIAPLAVFTCYPPYWTRLFEVEQSGEVRYDDKKRRSVSSEIEVVREISLQDLISAAMVYRYTPGKPPKDGYLHVDHAIASAHRCADVASVAGNHSTASVSLIASVARTLGENCVAAATGGRNAAIAGGDGYAGNIAAAADFFSYACADGGCGVAVATGKQSAVEAKGSSVAVASGFENIAKGDVGSALVFIERDQTDGRILNIKAVVVDDETVKADTYYTMRDGELVEAEQPEYSSAQENQETPVHQDGRQ